MNILVELKEDLKRIDKTYEDIKAFYLGLLNNEYKVDTLLKGTVFTEDLEPPLDIDYDEGFGSQTLFGTILFTDNTWLSRGEYDGAEWWRYNKPPTTESVLYPFES